MTFSFSEPKSTISALKTRKKCLFLSFQTNEGRDKDYLFAAILNGFQGVPEGYNARHLRWQMLVYLCQHPNIIKVSKMSKCKTQ